MNSDTYSQGYICKSYIVELMKLLVAKVMLNNKLCMYIYTYRISHNGVQMLAIFLNFYTPTS